MIDFTRIDTQEKSYLLGFIAADGNINKQRNTLTIGLSMKDYDFLRKIGKLIDPDRSLRVYQNKKEVRYGYFFCHSKRLCEQLSEWNIVPRKSLILRPPHILDEFIPHYVRGYFDGDGYVSEKTPLQVHLTGTSWVLEWISANFREYHWNNVNIIQFPTWSRLKFSQRTAEAFLKWIYKDSQIHLRRKYERSRRYIQEEWTNPIINQHWTADEITLLVENRSKATNELLAIFPSRSYQAIQRAKTPKRLKQLLDSL